jgi:RNA polymerase sigma factor (sigma-70 family)
MQMKKISDSQIIEMIKNRDDKVIGYIRRKYLPIIEYMIKNYAYSNGKNYCTAEESDVDDVFQEALYVLIERVWEQDFKLTSSLITFFYAVCRNILKVKLNKKLLEVDFRDYNYMQLKDNNDTDKLYDLELKRQLFDHYFEKLSDRCRSILKLYWKEFPVPVIARDLGVTMNFVMKRKYECIKRLSYLIKSNPDKFIP